MKRYTELLFLVVTLSEIGVGIVVALFPQALALLLAAPLDASGLLVARMMGASVFALGITWWYARGDARHVSRCAPGYLIYNFGVGILFALAAQAAANPALPWLVAAAHILAGAGLIAAVRGAPTEGTTP